MMGLGFPDRLEGPDPDEKQKLSRSSGRRLARVFGDLSPNAEALPPASLFKMINLFKILK
jgi:hypothetical protein